MYEEFIDSQRISTEAEYSRVYKYLDRYKACEAGECLTYNENIKKIKRYGCSGYRVWKVHRRL